MLRNLCLLLLGSALIAPTSPAQDLAAPKPDGAQAKPDAEAVRVLEKACTTMQNLGAVTFKTSESQDSAMMRRFRKQMPGMGESTTEVEGTTGPGTAHLTFDEGAQEVIVAGTRSIARKTEGTWRLHRGTLANGDPMPFVLEPQQLFEALNTLSADSRKVLNAEPTKHKNNELMLVTFEISGKEAKQLAKSGLLPRFTGGPMIAIGPAGHMRNEAGETSYDVGLWIEPGTGNVHRMRVRGFQKDAMAGNVQIQINGGGGEEDTDDDEANEEPAKADHKLKLKDGLPARGKKKDVSELEFEANFTNPAKVTPLELSKEAQELLRPAGKR